MKKGWAKLLTEEAAYEDACIWFTSFGKVFKKIYFYFTEPFRDEISPYIEEIGPKETFQNILSIVNLYPGDYRYSKDFPLFNSYEVLKISVKNMYAFARGEDIPDVNDVDRIISAYCFVTKKIALFIYTAQEAESDNIFQSFVSPRFAHALKMFKARSHIQNNICLDSIHPTLYHYIEPGTLSDLAGVHYTYIIKLIRTGKLVAEKKEGTKFWQIPVKDAVKYLLTRRNCPEWLKRLHQKNT